MPVREYGPGVLVRKDAAQEPGTVVSVATSSTPVSVGLTRGAGERVFCNDGANIIYLRLAATGATLNQGIRLNANGGSVMLSSYTGPVCGIAVTAATNLTVTEV
jgi:hypothetical protein